MDACEMTIMASINGTTPTGSERCQEENEADEIAERIAQRQNFDRHGVFGTTDGRLRVFLLRSVRGDDLE